MIPERVARSIFFRSIFGIIKIKQGLSDLSDIDKKKGSGSLVFL